MKTIAIIADDIRDELEGAEHYAKLATQYKMTDKALADTYFAIASQELAHVESFHAQVARIIKDERAAGHEPPPGMMDVWNFEHERHIDSVAKIKMLLEQYRK